MSKKTGSRQRRTKARAEPDPVRLLEYEITTEPIEDARYRRLPRHVKDAFERLHFEAQLDPEKAIPELLEWIEDYPRIPMLYNYLSVAYAKSGQPDKARAVVEENYRRNPDYLFARMNYAQQYLAKGDYKKVAEIFDHKFDLKLLYPRRKRFHISEFTNFAGLVGVYFVGIGDHESAAKYYDLLKQIAPGDPATRRLRRKLRSGRLRRLLRRQSGGS